jgi:hypothetical protein
LRCFRLTRYDAKTGINAVEIGEYRGVVRVPRRVFQRLLPERPTPERCIETYFLQRTRFETIAERKLRRRAVDRGRDVEISGRTCADVKARFFTRRQALAVAGEAG